MNIGGLAQSFSIFVALSILLGRVYLILYAQKLGIPVSSINIGLTDHAIFAPDITIMSVSIAISISLLARLVTGAEFREEIEDTISPFNKWVIVSFVLVMLVIGFLMVVIPAFIFTGPNLLSVGIRGGVTASGIILVSLGMVGVTWILRAKLTMWFRFTAQYVGYAMVLGTLVWSLSWSIVAFASDDAFKAVTESPTAILEVAPGQSPMEPVNVIYVNDNFTFVVNASESKSARDKYKSLNEARRVEPGVLQIYAIPNQTIRRIHYIGD